MAEINSNTKSPAVVLENLRDYFILEKKAPEVWVRHDLRTRAELVLENLKRRGEILSYEYREDHSTRGSANYLVQYPS